jgi:hypothetical protein
VIEVTSYVLEYRRRNKVKNLIISRRSVMKKKNSESIHTENFLKTLRKLENNTNAPAVNPQDKSETTETEKIHRPLSTRQM